jgi:hypothetical protein
LKYRLNENHKNKLKKIHQNKSDNNIVCSIASCESDNVNILNNDVNPYQFEHFGFVSESQNEFIFDHDESMSDCDDYDSDNYGSDEESYDSNNISHHFKI